MIPFVFIAGGVYLLFDALGNKRPSIDPSDYGLPTKGFRGYRKGTAHFAKGGIYGTGKTSKKEIISAIKQYQATIKDKEELKEELKSKDISDYEIDLIENKKLPELVERENVLHTQISFLLKKYGMENDYKPFEMNKGLYSFMKEQGFKDGGNVKERKGQIK